MPCRLITHSADLHQSAFKMRAGLSSTAHSDRENYRADAAINGVLVPDKLALRLVLGGTDYSGWIDSPGGDNVNDSETRNARLKVRALPIENLDIEFTGWTSRNDQGGAPVSGDQGIAINTIRDTIKMLVLFGASLKAGNRQGVVVFTRQ